MLNDFVRVTGTLDITLIDSITNEVKDYRELHNMVVTTGLNYIVQRMKTNTSTMSYIAIGTSASNLAMNNTQLANESVRVALTSIATNNSIVYSVTFDAGIGTGPIVEAGIFNASVLNTGTMLCRTTFPVVDKTLNDVLMINWRVTIG